MEDMITFSIKGMVCNRCKKVLSDALTGLGLEIKDISLGAVTVKGLAGLDSTAPIEQLIRENGFELLQDRNTVIVSEIKRLIDEDFHQSREYEERQKFSVLLTDHFPMSYERLSQLFSALEGTTIEKYIIQKRLDKVKELLVYTNLTLTQIARQAGFSSVFHLSNQFKGLTGIAPSRFRREFGRHQLINSSLI